MIEYVFLEVTSVCNHRCIHCSKNKTHIGIPSTASRELIDKVLSIPKKCLTISGGEPSMVKDELDYIIERESSHIKINTNLSGFSHDDIHRFNAMGNKCTLAISVPSMNQPTFTEITGNPNTFPIIVDNLEHLNKRNNLIVIILDRYNIYDAEYTVTKLAAIGYKDFIISPDITLSLDAQLVQDSIKIIKNIIKMHVNLNITALNSIYGIPCNHKCDAGVKRIVIDINGDILPCVPLVDKIVFGNLNNYKDTNSMMSDIQRNILNWMKNGRKSGCQCNPTLID